jgi:Flp pilus assembly protein TadD
VRKALFATVVAGGIAPFLAVGCTSNNGPTMANNTASSDWFGIKKLAGLFKSDENRISNTDAGNPHDPTSLAYEGKPPGADLYVSMARLHERQNNVAGAETLYQRALQTSPTDLDALLSYAHLLDRQGKLDEATTYYRKAVEHHPQDAAAHNDLGLCYARQGKLTESLVALSKAVELAPDKKLYRNNIATVFVEQGQPQRALEHLSVAEEPGVAHYNLACLLHQRGQTQTAAVHFAEAARRDPSLTGAQQLAQSLAADTGGARMTNVRPVEQVSTHRANTQWPPASGRAAVASSPAAAERPTNTGADRNWSAYDASSAASPSAGNASTARGSAYAMPPTPETASNYSVPASAAVDMLPPVEQSVPRY